MINVLTPCHTVNFNCFILGKVKIVPGRADDLTMLFQQIGAGDFSCPKGKTSKEEQGFECTGVGTEGQPKIWGKVIIQSKYTEST